MKYDKVKRNGVTYFRYRHWDPVLKKHDVTFYSRTYAELVEKYQNYQAKQISGVHENNESFSDYCKNWLYNIHLMDKKPSTAQRYDSTFRNYIKDSYVGKMKLKNITSDHLQKWYNDFFDEKAAAGQNAENAVKNLHKVISPCFRHAYKTGRIFRNYAEFVILPKNMTLDSSKSDKKDRVHPLTLEEQMSFIEAIKGHPLEALLNTALDTGMRQGELFALTWNDVDFENKTFHINKTYGYIRDLKLNKMVGMVTPPKSKKSIRDIPIPERTKKILLKHKHVEMERFKRMGVDLLDTDLVFSTTAGTYFDGNNVLHRLKKIYSGIGIEGKTFHDLRHTYATRLFELGEEPRTVQELLGHSDINITLGTYVHVLENLKKKTASKIDELYKPPTSKVSDKNNNIISIGQFLDNRRRAIK